MEIGKKIIHAKYNDKTIRVYQAYNDIIADEAVKLQTFGKHFKIERMTWIKPSFLWMMYRAGWAEKENQERILAIDITIEGFLEILSNVALSTYNSKLYGSYEQWKEKLATSEVRCQWDPDRDIYGNPQDNRAIQLGLKGSFVERYVKEWICKIIDITEDVIKWREEIKSGIFNKDQLPVEKVFEVSEEIKTFLAMS